MGGRAGSSTSCPVYQASEGGAPALFKGTAIFYVDSLDLLKDLQLMPQVPVTSVVLVQNDGVLLNFNAADPRPVASELAKTWHAHAGGPASFTSPLALTSEAGKNRSFLSFSLRLTQGGVASLLVDASVFEMTDLMKGLLLGTFFLTVFLIALPAHQPEVRPA